MRKESKGAYDKKKTGYEGLQLGGICEKKGGIFKVGTKEHLFKRGRRKQQKSEMK